MLEIDTVRSAGMWLSYIGSVIPPAGILGLLMQESHRGNARDTSTSLATEPPTPSRTRCSASEFWKLFGFGSFFPSAVRSSRVKAISGRVTSSLAAVLPCAPLKRNVPSLLP